MLSHASAQRLRLPGYAIMAMLIIGEIVDVTVRSSPFRVHSPAWRLGYLSGLAGESSMILVGLFVALLIAAVADDRTAALVVAGSSWAISVGYLLATVLFLLDVIQFKGQVPGPLAEQYGAGSGWLTIRMLIAVGLLAILGLASLRIARAVGQRGAAGAGDGALVGRTRSTPQKTVNRV